MLRARSAALCAKPMTTRPAAAAALLLLLWWCSAAAVVVSAWNTTGLYGATRVRLADVAVWRNRAYACWPRLDASQPATLLELPWPETAAGQSVAQRRKPNRPFRADQQKLGDCRLVQSAVALDLDRIRGHLYVLDSGYRENCRPKIVVYDLKTYRRVQRTELDGLNGSGLSALAVDSRPLRGETRAYVGGSPGGHLAVFDPDSSVWHRVALIRGRDDHEADGDDVVPSECVAVSKLRSSVYLTSTRSRRLYSASLRDLRNSTYYVKPGAKNGDVLPTGLRVRREGVKLGRSSGLYADIQGGLNYVYTRDFVAVRLSLAGVRGTAAENHEVLLQSYELLPAVTKIFADGANYLQVWALNAVPNAENRHSVKINTLTLS